MGIRGLGDPRPTPRRQTARTHRLYMMKSSSIRFHDIVDPFPVDAARLGPRLARNEIFSGSVLSRDEMADILVWESTIDNTLLVGPNAAVAILAAHRQGRLPMERGTAPQEAPEAEVYVSDVEVRRRRDERKRRTNALRPFPRAGGRLQRPRIPRRALTPPHGVEVGNDDGRRDREFEVVVALLDHQRKERRLRRHDRLDGIRWQAARLVNAAAGGLE